MSGGLDLQSLSRKELDMPQHNFEMSFLAPDHVPLQFVILTAGTVG